MAADDNDIVIAATNCFSLLMKRRKRIKKEGFSPTKTTLDSCLHAVFPV